MDIVERLDIECHCRRLVADYAHYWDSLDFDSWLDLFSEDMSFENEGARTIEGKEWMRKSLAKRQPTDFLTRHVIVNVVIDVQDSTHASGRASMVLFRAKEMSDTPLTAEGLSDFEANFVKTNEGWRIQRRYARRRISYQKPEGASANQAA